MVTTNGHKKEGGSNFLRQKIRVLMVGCGKMGNALLTRWLDQTEFTFTVVSPSARKVPDGVVLVRTPEAIQGAQFDLVVLAVKPQMMPQVLPAYRGLLADEGCFLSMAAGFATSSFEAVAGEKPLVRIMPNLPVQIGKGVSALGLLQETVKAAYARAVALR